MGKLHELLAVEQNIVAQAKKLMAETSMKFNKFAEYLTGGVRTLQRLNDSAEDKAIEVAQRKEKVLPTNVTDTLAYIFPHVNKFLEIKLSKHLTNQVAVADLLVDDVVVMGGVPVDFLLDLEKFIPELRAMFEQMPTLDPSREWISERKGVWKSKTPIATTQTEKQMYPVELAPATKEHKAQVKEATRDVAVGTFFETHISGAATTQQKAEALALCDKLLNAVKQARMRANSVDIEKPTYPVTEMTKLFSNIFA